MVTTLSLALVQKAGDKRATRAKQEGRNTSATTVEAMGTRNEGRKKHMPTHAHTHKHPAS